MGGGAAAEQQTHGVALIAEGGLHPDEHVAKLLSIDEQLLTVAVQVSWWLAPVLLEGLAVLAQALVLVHLHAVGHIEVAGVELCVLGGEHALDELVTVGGQGAHIIALLLQVTQHLVDGAKHVQVRGGAHIALVRGEAEHSDGQLLLGVGLLAKLGPVDGTTAQAADSVGQGVGLAGVAVTASKHNGLNATIQLGQGHLKCDLHGVHTQI
mmetsp:Transcript_11146/g.19490  ORF Transcript_11146/g.19490 Transcript_11146/m.19490 type:complete len:210 (+) Transcript_11146:2752-3381(+)